MEERLKEISWGQIDDVLEKLVIYCIVCIVISTFTPIYYINKLSIKY